MKYAQFLSGVSFRLLGPHSERDAAGWYWIERADGSIARLLGLPGQPLDLYNCILPDKEAAGRASLRDLCSIPKMSTFAIGAVVNRAVSQMSPDQAFVNVGVWNGFTFLCGLTGNTDRQCVGIDNFSQFGGPRDAFLERFNRRKGPLHRFFDMDYAEYFSRIHRNLIGVYIYDGEHSYGNQLKGLQAAEPFFADDCIIVVDDTNWLDPWRGTMDFVARSKNQYRVLLDHTTCGNGHPSFWNGILVLQKCGPGQSTVNTSGSSPNLRRAESSEPKPPAVSWHHAISPEQRLQAPLVSLVIIHSLTESALDGIIASALRLTYPNLEIILVDDLPRDDSSQIAQSTSSGVRILRTGGTGLTAAIRAGLNASRGQWVAFLDSAAALVPSAVEVGLNFGLDTLGCTHSQTDWYERCACLLIEMTRIVAPNRTVVLADDTQLGINANLMGRRVVPFLERDGQYNGQPADDATAMTELERLRDAGADYFACAWPSFWWLEHYRGFSAYLRSGFQCLVDNSELKVFDLHGTNKRVRV